MIYIFNGISHRPKLKPEISENSDNFLLLLFTWMYGCIVVDIFKNKSFSLSMSDNIR